MIALFGAVVVVFAVLVAPFIALILGITRICKDAVKPPPTSKKHAVYIVRVEGTHPLPPELRPHKGPQKRTKQAPYLADIGLLGIEDPPRSGVTSDD